MEPMRPDMSKTDDLLAYIEALEDFCRPFGRFKDGQASPTPTREGITCYGVAIDNSTIHGRTAIRRYDRSLKALQDMRAGALKRGEFPTPAPTAGVRSSSPGSGPVKDA